MKVVFELLTLFRQKAGADRLELEVGAPASTPGCAPATVLEALRAAEARLGGQALLDGEKLRQGVLVFLRDARGTTRRVFHPAEERIRSGQAVVLSTAMGGG
jgi:hypothetical protein